MKLSDVFNAQAVALNYTGEPSNQLEYIGQGFFPPQKKAGLDLKWIKGFNGLPVSLKPSTFDAKSTLRDRVGVSINETEMAFFRESMLVSEKDEQEIMRVTDSNDPYAVQVLDNIFNDAKTLIDGALVVPERMCMQLLAPLGGDMGINIVANNANYTYNYDPDGSWKSAHYAEITTAADMWNAPDTCDPFADLEAAIDAQEQAGGNRPEVAIMSKATFNMIKKSKAVQSYILAQNTTANVFVTDKIVRDFLETELAIRVVIYNKQYRDESGVAKKFYPDNIVMLVPNGSLGKTWFGTTPEERTLMGKPEANVSIVNTGITVSVTTTTDPVNTKTTVSEIVLPSFENLNACYALQVVSE
jgi:hypothetical protein